MARRRRTSSGWCYRRGITLALLGAVIGVVGSIAVSGVIGSRHLVCPALDPLTLLATGAALVVVAAAASAVPAVRAVRIDPVRALREG